MSIYIRCDAPDCSETFDGETTRAQGFHSSSWRELYREAVARGWQIALDPDGRPRYDKHFCPKHSLLVGRLGRTQANAAEPNDNAPHK